MNALLIVHLNVKDPQALLEYRQSVGATLAAFGGTPLLSGKVAEVLEGEHARGAAVVIEFPNTEAITAWFQSPEYQALTDLRREAMDATFISISRT